MGKNDQNEHLIKQKNTHCAANTVLLN